MQLNDTADTRKVWNHQFKLLYTLVLKSTSLSVQFQCTNTGDKSFDFTALLHSYLAVQHISKVRISGLNNVQYIDKVLKGCELTQSDDVSVSGETDRIYCNVSSDRGVSNIRLSDAGNADIVIKSKQFNDVVVWNPWIDKARGMSDMGDDDYERFVCIEPGYVSQPYTLESGETFTASVGYSLVINDKQTSKI